MTTTGGRCEDMADSGRPDTSDCPECGHMVGHHDGPRGECSRCSTPQASEGAEGRHADAAPPDIREICERDVSRVYCACEALLEARELGIERGMIDAANFVVDRLNAGTYCVEGGAELEAVRDLLVSRLKGK